MLQSDIYDYGSIGYLVKDGKVLLVHHKRFNNWVPPGGRVESNETFAEATTREFLEETGLLVEPISFGPQIHRNDSNASFQPLPFYTDILTEGFPRPTLCFYYFVKLADQNEALKLQTEELHDIGWFNKAELETLPMFDQARSLSLFALQNYPKV